MSDSDFYQLERVKSDLEDLKSGQKLQEQILVKISGVLEGIQHTINSLSGISKSQIRMETQIKVLQDESGIFKNFMKDRECDRHTSEINALKKSDDSQNKNITTFVLAILGALITGAVTYFFTKG